MIDCLNKGEIKDNDQFLKALRAGLKLDVKTLKQKYTDFSLAVKR